MSIDKVEVVQNDVKVNGNVNDEDLSFVVVNARKEGEAEAIKQENAKVEKKDESSYTFEVMLRNMNAGKYTTVVKAYDMTELTGSDSKDFEIECVMPPSASGTIQEHCETGRIPWAEYSQYYLKYGSQTFTVYQWTDGTWREQKPTCDGTSPSNCISATLSNHVSAGRAYTKSSGMWWWSTTTYYAKGSNDVLGNYSLANASLLETQPDYWKKIDFCPAE